MINHRRNRKYISRVVLASMLTGLGVYANAGELTLTGGVTLSSGGTATVGADGLASQVTGVSTANKGIPNFSLNMPATGIADGTYKYKLGVVFDDDNSTSRVEVLLPSLVLTAAGNVVSGELDETLKIRVLARDADLNIDVQLTVPTDNPISVNSNTFSFDMAKVLAAVADDHPSIEVILNSIAVARHFTYTIVAQQTVGDAIQLGVNEGTFSAFPRIQSSCSADSHSSSSSVFQLQSNALASQFTLAYAIQGQYSVTGATGSSGAEPTAFTEDCAVSGGGGGTTPPADVVEGADDVDDAVTAIEIPTSGPVSEETVTQVNDVVTNGGTLATNIAEQLTGNTLSTTGALSGIESVNKTLTVAGAATKAGAGVNSTAAVTTINNIANALTALSTKTLTSTEKATVVTLATNTLTSATNLIAKGASNESIQAIVAASAKILEQSSSISGSIGEEIATQVKILVTQAINTALPNLPASILADTDLSNLEEVQELLTTDPSAYGYAIQYAVTVAPGSFVTLSAGSWTPGEAVFITYPDSLTLALKNNNGSSLSLYEATGDITTSTDSVTGNLTINGPTERYVAASPTYRLVPDLIPTGINFLPDGTAVMVGNGVAAELAPTALDSAGFNTAVTDAGLALTYRDNGTVNIALGNNERFSGAFAYDNLIAATSCGAISIAGPVGNLTDAGYAFTLTCANGPVQHVTPIADNELFYTTIANAGLSARTDRNTGIVTIASVGSFKPSFFVTPLTVNDQAFLAANKNAEGVVFRAKDANADGKMDYEFIASTGVQVFYGL